MRPHPARLDGEVDGELAVQHPTTPPILSALPPLAAMRKEWVEFDWGVLALHLLHQRHEAVGVESGTVELLTVRFLLCRDDFPAAVCRSCLRALTSSSARFGFGDGQIGK